jgi:4-hydroxyphenylacetate 3-monooxygenase
LRDLLGRYLCGANGVGAEDRARVFRLAWDFAGSALAGRNELYERFYLASGARNYQLANTLARRERALGLVDQMMSPASEFKSKRVESPRQIVNLPRPRGL